MTLGLQRLSYPTAFVLACFLPVLSQLLKSAKIAMSAPRDLFGGAITVRTAHDLVDASDLRQVPDTQEVFMYPCSSVSIVVEILQRAEPSNLDDAIRFHFDSLAHDNSARSVHVESVFTIPTDRGDNTPSATILYGTQSIPKFNQSVPDQVNIYMALFRIQDKSIDLVVTFNVPTSSVDGGAVNSTGVERAKADFSEFVSSLRIVDFGLFA
ncbi:unnamed protein product [Cyclocybe aegerita]|uniref:Ran guanine nucleotide release factor n=1 Tax=Cyclocybe aegerita TaxID=1973307 RepID=A0A8S0WPP5_CYCAE|nr:unnamed protein product [Cyclocybe aegerita]